VAGVMLAECADCWAVPLEEHRPNVNCCSRAVKQVIGLEGIQDLRIYTFGTRIECLMYSARDWEFNGPPITLFDVTY
jgi:hypothetical protein